MKNLSLLFIFLAVALFQASCKDFWHPEEAKYGAITFKGSAIHNEFGNYYNLYCTSAKAVNRDNGNNYQFENDKGKGEFKPLRVPAGYYTISAVYTGTITTSSNVFNHPGGNVYSPQFELLERGSKTLSFDISRLIMSIK
jgi:hypothetical protein